MAPARLSGRCARARPLPRARRGPRSPGRRLPGWRRWKSGPTRGGSRDGARRARSPAPRQLQGQTRGPPAPISPPQRRVKRWCSLPARAAAGNGVCEAVTGGGGLQRKVQAPPPRPGPGFLMRRGGCSCVSSWASGSGTKPELRAQAAAFGARRCSNSDF